MLLKTCGHIRVINVLLLWRKKLEIKPWIILTTWYSLSGGQLEMTKEK